MITRFLLVCLFGLLPGLGRGAEIALGKSGRIVFATVEEGRRVLTNRDDFVERLSPFDRAARLKTGEAVSEQSFLAFVATNVLAWTEAEKSLLESSLRTVQPRIEALRLPWPGRILLIRTTGNEEGAAAYTRANAIILPSSKLKAGKEGSLPALMCHELFHVLSRQNPELKDKLYAAIGFEKCRELDFPPGLIRITNPDAPKNDHCIRLKLDGNPVWAVPILHAKPAAYDPKRGGEFFQYLQFKLLAAEAKAGAGPMSLVFDAANPRLVEVGQVEGFYEQVGRNSQYIIHPEEILADNFAMLVQASAAPASPEVLRKMREILGKSVTAF